MGRAPCCDKNGLKKGPWTPEEDQKLTAYIHKHGHANWRTLPKIACLQRCGKSCRLRWTNYLRPDIKRGRFSFEEEETIIQLHTILGNKWSVIAARLPGRTDNEIKNYWNTHIRKRLLKMGIDPVTHRPRLDLLDLSSILTNSLYTTSQMNISRMLGVRPLVNPQLLRLATSLVSSSNQNRLHHQNQLLDQNHFIQRQQQSVEHVQTLDQPQNLSDFGDWQSSESGFDTNHDNVHNIPSNNFYHGADQAIIDPSWDDSMFHSHKNFDFALATPSSTSSPNSTTYVNGTTTEVDEPESLFSDMLIFDIPDILEAHQFTYNL